MYVYKYIQYADPKMACPSLIRQAIFGSAYCSRATFPPPIACQRSLWMPPLKKYVLPSNTDVNTASMFRGTPLQFSTSCG